MTGVSIVGPDDGEVMLPGPVRMRILEDGSTTSHRLGLGEITIAPHTEGPLQHRHAQHDEGFYVVSGTARFTVGEKSHDAGAGTLVMVPPGSAPCQLGRAQHSRPTVAPRPGGGGATGSLGASLAAW
jgi:uncharacterized RmlC-like cupin family protein